MTGHLQFYMCPSHKSVHILPDETVAEATIENGDLLSQNCLILTQLLIMAFHKYMEIQMGLDSEAIGTKQGCPGQAGRNGHCLCQ